MPLPVSKHTPAGSFDLKLSVQWKALNITENSCKALRKKVKKYLANERIHSLFQAFRWWSASEKKSERKSGKKTRGDWGSRPLPQSPLVFFPALSLALFFAHAPLSERLEQAREFTAFEAFNHQSKINKQTKKKGKKIGEEKQLPSPAASFQTRGHMTLILHFYILGGERGDSCSPSLCTVFAVLCT